MRHSYAEQNIRYGANYIVNVALHHLRPSTSSFRRVTGHIDDWYMSELPSSCSSPIPTLHLNLLLPTSFQVQDHISAST